MAPSPPPTRVDAVVEVTHGVEVHDPYRWLEDGEAPGVAEWVEEQRLYARSILDAYPSRARIEARIRELMATGLLGPSRPRGRRRFFTRRTGEMDQLALYESDRLLLDPLAVFGDPTAALDWYYPADDGELVAVGVSRSGDERSTLLVVEAATGRLLPDRIENCQWASVAFERGNAAILYTRYPEGDFYNQRAWRHVLGQPVEEDVQVWGEGREKTESPGPLSLSPNGRWTVVNSNRGWSASSIFLNGKEVFRSEDEIATAWFADERLLALTNAGAPNWRLVQIDPERPGREDWLDLVPEGPSVLLDAAVSADRLLVHHLVDASSKVSVHALEGAFEGLLDLPPLYTVTGLGADPSATHAYLTAESFTRPAFVLEVDPATGIFQEVDSLEMTGGFDPTRYSVRQVPFASKDGTRSRLFLVGRAEGSGPTVLTGYGGFNIPSTPAWRPSWLPFLEAGGLIAVATLRGGNEYGEAWHQAGTLGRKQNVFDDFIAAAETVIAEGLATPSSLGILGGSNGGLLVGAALVQRPDLFGAAVCRVPLLDMVRYERFRIAELWSREYGSAADPEAFSWLHAYSPYHHVRPGVRYSPVLLTTGEADARVDPMHARKMAARLQAANPGGLVLLRVEERAGHGQGKPVTKQVPEEADVWSFLMENLS